MAHQVDLFIPCFIDQCFPQTGWNMVKVLEAVGCRVNYNPNQTCCGQPAYNAGFFKEAAEIAGKFLSDFSNRTPYIVAPSASCVGMVKNHYQQLLKDTILAHEAQFLGERIFEFTQFLTDVVKVKPKDLPPSVLNGTATYHDSCSALRECKIAEGPRSLLNTVSGLTLLEMESTNDCCGFGGTFAVKFPAISAAMASQKVDNALATKADYIISTDTSCLMHLQAYIDKNNHPIKTMHIADVLASGW